MIRMVGIVIKVAKKRNLAENHKLQQLCELKNNK